MNLILSLLLLAPAALAGPSVSGGSSWFVDAVKKLRPLGLAFDAAGKSLEAQGFRLSAETSVNREDSGMPSVQRFIIEEHYENSSSSRLLVRVKGLQRTDPPGPGDKDIFQVDSLEVVND